MKTYKFETFTSSIEKNIRDGIYKPGQKLPSVRALKQQFQTSVSTIQNGYEHLLIQGLVVNIPRSGYYVAKDLPQKQKPAPQKNPVVRDAVFEKNIELITSGNNKKKIIEFNVATPGDLIISQKLLLRTMQQVIRERGASLLRYYPSSGSEALKSNIIKHAAGYQTSIDPEELLITDGALQSLYIALSSVCNAGDVVAVESPCVFSVLEVIRVLNLKVIEVPVHPVSGFDVQFFKKACQKNKIKAAIITPNFHNPTGTLISDEIKKEIVSIAQQHHIAVIENDIYGDLNFNGKRPSTLRSYDESGLVITYSSYSKTLAPGIRLGWLAAGKYLQRAEQIRFSMGSTVSPVYQETVNQLLSTNSYNRHLRAFRTQLTRNAGLSIQLFSDHFPPGITVIPPSGGYHIWVRMPDKINMNNFYKQCEKVGVKFTPGYTFSFSPMYSHYFRMVFADKFSASKIKALEAIGHLISI